MTAALNDGDFEELIENMETITLEHEQVLCTIGDPDDCIYILQEGKLHVSSASSVRLRL